MRTRKRTIIRVLFLFLRVFRVIIAVIVSAGYYSVCLSDVRSPKTRIHLT
jgi:hypothetical protein